MSFLKRKYVIDVIYRYLECGDLNFRFLTDIQDTASRQSEIPGIRYGAIRSTTCTSPRRMTIELRISKLISLMFISVVALYIGIGLLNNSARGENLFFKDGLNTLSAYYKAPDADKPTKGVVIFVHGDGAAPYDGYGYYDPIWNIVLQAGYAILSWDKPGVGRSEGNWLNQSMPDRQNEVLSAISFLKNKYGYGKGQIGLMGFSQAGWVVPAVAKNNDDVGFIIGVGFAMNWMDQGWYMTRKRMEENGDTAEEIEKAYHQHSADFEFLKTNPNYKQYQERYRRKKDLKSKDHDHLIPEDRFVFVKKNYLSGATDDYQGIKQPILILLGEQDLNVNVQNTQNSLRRIFNSQTNLNIYIIPNATHGLLRYPQFNTQNPGFGFLLRLLWEGENAYADGFLKKLGSWLDSRQLPAERSITEGLLDGLSGEVPCSRNEVSGKSTLKVIRKALTRMEGFSRNCSDLKRTQIKGS